MIVFFDKYTEQVEKLRETMRCIGQDVRIAVLEDDGFLPAGILSPYEFFSYRDRQEAFVERDLFYNFIELPEFWEVRLLGWMGGIFDMGCEKAKIYFREPAEKRNVQRVEWHMENGWVYKIDYYNKYALKYASEFLDTEGHVESRVFYSEKNQEMIIEQPVNHMITLADRGMVNQLFDSRAEFIRFYMEEAGLEGECILFVQEENTFEVLEPASDGGRMWTKVLFSDAGLLNRYAGMGGTNGSKFYEIPEHYRENRARREAMILTASDQVEQIEYLVRKLPDMRFHIAAHTQVSDKLYKLEESGNVKVYPQISRQDLDMLWETCDFYLDINHYYEIYDAVNQAQIRNQIILGFEYTLHHRELMAEEGIFDGSEGEKMALAIKNLLVNPERVQELLDAQQQKKREIWKGL
ncbi:MAG: accessory Sec system glycosyltransferase GtfB [Dorea sp.]|nr:accessory Sec system glycosyltransferase GtfB [Dorea sp.]